MTAAPKPPLRISRRDFACLGAGAFLGAGLGAGAFAMIGLAPRTARAQQQEAAAPDETAWQRHIRAITGDKAPTEDKVTLELPEVVENGNLVPFTVAVDYVMADTDFIQALHVIGTGNPSPPIASFYFSPLAGAARASSRMRLRDTQEVIALAQTSGGEFFIGRRRVEVIVGCCGG